MRCNANMAMVLGMAMAASMVRAQAPQGTEAMIKPPSTAAVKYYSKAESDAQFEKQVIILDSGHDGRYFVETSVRVKPGDAETHLDYTDVFYVVKGSATIVTGGTAGGMLPNGAARVGEPVSPGELRAKSIVGGEPRHLSVGDTLIIPNGVPHQFTKVQGPFWYLVVKIRATSPDRLSNR